MNAQELTKSKLTTLKPYASLLLLLVLIWSMASSCSQSKEGDNYAAVRENDAAMNAAISKAQSTSAEFVRAFHDQKPGTTDFLVKKPYPTPSGSHEHMW